MLTSIDLGLPAISNVGNGSSIGYAKSVNKAHNRHNLSDPRRYLSASINCPIDATLRNATDNEPNLAMLHETKGSLT
jgi:hypothetical protein